MKAWIIIVKLLFLGALFIVSNYNLHLSNSDERSLFLDRYSSWLGDLVDHGTEVTAFVVKFEWLPSKNIGENLNIDSEKSDISARSERIERTRER